MMLIMEKGVYNDDKGRNWKGEDKEDYDERRLPYTWVISEVRG